jgi:hypothetical protein
MSASLSSPNARMCTDYKFFSVPQRMQCLKKKFDEIGLKRQKLKAPSTTCWVQRVSSLDGIVESFWRSLKYMKLNENGNLKKSTSDAEMYYKSCIDCISCQIKSFHCISCHYIKCPTSHFILDAWTTTKEDRHCRVPQAD